MMIHTRRGLLAGLAAALAAPAIVRASSLMNVSVLPADYLSRPTEHWLLLISGTDAYGRWITERVPYIGGGRHRLEISAIADVALAT